MKKLALFLVIVLVISSIFSVAFTASAQTETNYEAYNYYKRYSVECRQRFAGTEGELNAARYISQVLYSFGYYSLTGHAFQASYYLQSFDGEYSVYNSETYEYSTEKINSQNVVAYKRCGKENAKLLVIGCAYDNGYGYNDIKNEGAYENSSAVATLLQIANELTDANLDFDVAFAFFGAEFVNHLGARKFLEENKQTVLGYINLDAIGGGDDLYVYYDDVKTAHGEFIDGIIQKFSFNVKGAPFNKGIYAINNDIVDRPYFHVGLDSSNYLFIEKEIPSVHLFGYNWAEFGGGESSEHDDIWGTENDTFEYMEKAYGQERIAERLNLAVDLVVSTVLRNNELASAFEKYSVSYTNLYSSAVNLGIGFGLIALIIILFIVGYSLASKKTQSAGKADFSTNSSFLNGNSLDTGAQKKDDVFDFGDEPIISDNNDVDTHENSSGNSDDDIFGEF